MVLQRTIRKRVAVEGIGLHTGKSSKLTFCPAPENSGIHFVRKDLENSPSVQVSEANVVNTQNATTLGNKIFEVSTVEHCLSALSALRIDNLDIELDGPEIPIVDGSAQHYLSAILSSGLIEQNAARKYANVLKPLEHVDGDRYAKVAPYNGLRITCTIDFSHRSIGVQTFDIDVNQYSFTEEIAPARTFGFLRDAEYLWSKGLALGGSLENTIVLNDDGVMNPEPLRFEDEFVRHKVLDALGDLTTIGVPLLGHLTLYKAGHDVMNGLIRKILSQPESCNILELTADDQDLSS